MICSDDGRFKITDDISKLMSLGGKGQTRIGIRLIDNSLFRCLLNDI